eukprot:gb/GECG01002265.1/.p1 GENE.gb/GECG01002265.1/~~gb/GECG01002265.1/.p1  ORF type:complete len:117 (+),score=5.40 gb/GECG01002265.1/:1-351(+)
MVVCMYSLSKQTRRNIYLFRTQPLCNRLKLNTSDMQTRNNAFRALYTAISAVLASAPAGASARVKLTRAELADAASVMGQENMQPLSAHCPSACSFSNDVVFFLTLQHLPQTSGRE